MSRQFEFSFDISNHRSTTSTHILFVALSLRTSLPKALSNLLFNNTSEQSENDKTATTSTRKKLQLIAQRAGFKGLDDWYTITRSDFIRFGGLNLLRKSRNGFPHLISETFNEHSWDLARFVFQPRQLVLAKRREEVIKIGERIGITSQADWYNVRYRDFERNGGEKLLSFYGRSIPKMLSILFPEHKWERENFRVREKGYWQNLQNQREFLLDIGEKLGIKLGDFESWYGISREKIAKFGGGRLLDVYEGSPSKMIQSVFSEHKWDPSKWPSKPRSYWNSKENQRKFLEQLGERLNFKSGFESWYSITQDDLLRNGGSSLLRLYDSSPSLVVSSVFSEHEWDFDKFVVKPLHYWQSIENQRRFLIEVGEKLGIKPGDYNAWYRVTYGDIVKFKGRGLLDIYGQSPYHLISSVFPEHRWEPWKFQRGSPKALTDPRTLELMAKAIEEHVGIQIPTEFSKVTSLHLADLELDKIIKNGDDLRRLLISVYPSEARTFESLTLLEK